LREDVALRLLKNMLYWTAKNNYHIFDLGDFVFCISVSFDRTLGARIAQWYSAGLWAG
jgi:hypothetical protein